MSIANLLIPSDSDSLVELDHQGDFVVLHLEDFRSETGKGNFMVHAIAGQGGAHLVAVELDLFDLRRIMNSGKPRDIVAPDARG